MSIEVGPQPSQGIGGIPTRYVVIGAGVLGLAAILLMQKKEPTSTSASGDVQPTGSVSAQLSSVQQLQLQQYGELTKMLAATGTQIGSLGQHFESQAAALSSSINSSQAQTFQQNETIWNSWQWLRNLLSMDLLQRGVITQEQLTQYENQAQTTVVTSSTT